MSTRTEGKKRHIDRVTDGAILVVKGARDASESFPVLTPLKNSMGVVITLLENIKKARKNKEDWASLAQAIDGRLKSVQDAVTRRPSSAAVEGLVSEYSKVLERVAQGLVPLAESQSNWLRAALDAERDNCRIKNAIREMDEGFKGSRL